LTSSQGARFLRASERAWNLLVRRSPTRHVPRIPPSKLAGLLWPTGRPIQRRSGPRFPRQPRPAWSSHPLLTAGALITDAAPRSRIHGNGRVGGIERAGIPGEESVKELEAFDKTNLTAHCFQLGSTHAQREDGSEQTYLGYGYRFAYGSARHGGGRWRGHKSAGARFGR